MLFTSRFEPAPGALIPMFASRFNFCWLNHGPRTKLSPFKSGKSKSGKREPGASAPDPQCNELADFNSVETSSLLPTPATALTRFGEVRWPGPALLFRLAAAPDSGTGWRFQRRSRHP